MNSIFRRIFPLAIIASAVLVSTTFSSCSTDDLQDRVDGRTSLYQDFQDRRQIRIEGRRDRDAARWERIKGE